ncbi:MAG TPA: NUDIX hydrolase [Candidatus Baltobacteraceae bacterium]|jgi:8-oxo-dGTP pyrophosphatase MutT (NUDIX family)|nr:NUDIX hydrolase [Candidatus Baltobacteraceae bacterium]
MIEPWRKLSSRRLGDFRVFSVREERKLSPRTGAAHDFFIIDSANWVNIIALTADARIVLVEQYRHGSETVELEIPGGIMDAADASPEITGCRELLEETGYEGEQPQIIGQVFPNPAIMSNVCFTVCVRNCRYVKPVHFDSSEDIVTRLVALAEVPELVASGRIRHALIVAALYQFDLWWKRQS